MKISLFDIIGIEVFEVNTNDGNPTILFRNLDEQFLTQLRVTSELYINDSFWLSVNNKIKTLVYNRIKFDNIVYDTEDKFLEFIKNNYPIYSPSEKLDLVLEFLYNRTSYDGQLLDLELQREVFDTEVWRKYYLSNKDEFLFYIHSLKSQGLIDYKNAKYELVNLHLTIEGLTKIIKNQENANSRECFVAMAFDDSLKSVYANAIQPAIIETGFLPIIISNTNVEPDKTINDAIIAAIKKAYFVIADFTMHKAGVYFEAGYALGRGIKVIYTCKKDDIKNAHFDTRNFQHLLWESEEDLKIQLINKINAVIKE